MTIGFPLQACPLIQATGPDPRLIKANASSFHKAADGNTSLSASGFLWPESCTHKGKGHRVVLTSASIIWPFLKQNCKSRFKSADGSSLLSGSRVAVIIDQGDVNTNPDSYSELPGHFAGFIPIPEFGKMLHDVLYRGQGGLSLGWKLGNLTQKVGSEQHVDIVSHLAAITVDEMLLDQEGPAVGFGSGHEESHYAHAIGSPFGCISPHHFLHCVVNGTVSQSTDGLNTSWGRSEEQHAHVESLLSGLLVFDGHTLPGMEGGLVVHRDSLKVVGVMSLPLHSSRREYPLMIGIHLIVEGFLKWRSRQIDFAPSSVATPVNKGSWGNGNELGRVTNHTVSLGCPSGVVKVSVSGGGWGSGVVVSSTGFILTCSHVLGKSEVGCNHKIHVQCNGSRWHRAELVYRFNGYLDLAILKLSDLPSVPQTPVVLTGGTSGALSGRTCFAVGFGREHQTQRTAIDRAVITRGNIAKVVYHPHEKKTAVMLINAVSVYPGSSGGALFLDDGTFAGLITGNTMHSTGQLLAHFSFGIPVETLRPIFEWMNPWRLESMHELNRLDVLDHQAASIWSLSKPPPPAAKTDEPPGGQAFKAYVADLRASHNKLKSRL